MSEYKIFWKKSKKCLTNRFYSAIIDYADLRGCWNRQTGKLEVLVSVLACGFKSHFPHQCKGHSIFECPLFLYLGKSANYYHQKQSRWNRTKSLISWKRNLFRRQTAPILKLSTIKYAGVAELADALASGASDRKVVWVQVPSPAPRQVVEIRLVFYC